MVISTKFCKPDFFITMTANLCWPEILAELKPEQAAAEQPDIVARMFKLYFVNVINKLKDGLFDLHVAHVYTIEYQKRGLPHMHFLLFLYPSACKYLTPALVDQVVCTELPDPSWEATGKLCTLVITFMLHGL